MEAVRVSHLHRLFSIPEPQCCLGRWTRSTFGIRAENPELGIASSGIICKMSVSGLARASVLL